MAKLVIAEQGSDPSTPAPGARVLYPMADGWYEKDDGGNVNGPFTISPNGGDAFRTRYRITPSVASNNLTVAIKYLDGNDCTAINKIIFRVGNTEYTLDTSVGYTKNAATNWHNSGSSELAAKDVDYFVYAIGETGANAGLKFGHSRIPYATTMADFVNTTTSEKYIAGNWVNFNTTDSVVVIGRFRAQLSATASFNWSIPSAKVIDYPIFETDWLSWTPTNTTQAGTWTAISIENVEYRIRMGELLLNVTNILGTTSTTTTFFDVTLPFAVANGSVGSGRVINGGSGIWAMTTTVPATPGGLRMWQYNLTAFTAGAGRGILEATIGFRI